MTATLTDQSSRSSRSSDRPLRSEEWMCRELDGEGIFYDVATDTTCRLNETAMFIWTLCDGDHGVDEISERLAARYDVGAERSHRDVRDTLDHLGSLGIVSSGQGPVL